MKMPKMGRPLKHGAYSIISKISTNDQCHRHGKARIVNYVNGIRKKLIEDLGPTEEKLNAGQKAIIDRVTTLINIVRIIELYAEENGVFENNEMRGCLKEQYLSYNNAIRSCIQLLYNSEELKSFLRIKKLTYPHIPIEKLEDIDLAIIQAKKKLSEVKSINEFQ